MGQTELGAFDFPGLTDLPGIGKTSDMVIILE